MPRPAAQSARRAPAAAAGRRSARAGGRARGAPRGRARIVVLGAGAVGESLAGALVRCGHAVALWSRTRERASAAAKRARCTTVADLAAAVAGADLVLFCARDAGLPALVARVAELALPPRPRVALHTSGALGARALAPLAARAFGIGALHPLAPVPPRAPSDVYRGVGFAVEAPDPAVRAVGAALARELGGEPFEVASTRGARARYHAAATLLSNGTLALYALALRELLPARFARGAAARAFATLLERTARNLKALPPRRALTGPVARADLATLRTHLAVLPRTTQSGAVYRLLSRELARLAHEDRRIDARTARALTRTLA